MVAQATGLLLIARSCSYCIYASQWSIFKSTQLREALLMIEISHLSYHGNLC